MFNIFYQANFCAECGNALESRRGWRPCYFCDYCAAQMRRRRAMTPLLLLTGLLVVSFLLVEREHSPAQPGQISASPAVSAKDASPKQNPSPQAPIQERVFCGARTKKGTPCRHLVHPGQRCAQHHGMPSMIELEQPKK